MTSITSIQLEETKNSIANDIINTLDQIIVKKNDTDEIFEDNQVNEGNLTNIWLRSPSYTNSYDEEWCRLFSGSNVSIESLRRFGLLGELRNCRFRSVYWRVYLGILSEHSERWKEEVEKERAIYIDLRNKYIIDPRNKSIISDDPLSINNESQWNKYFRSQDVIKEIQQDVVRTFPEIEFFHSTAVRTSMINVLYCYSQTSRLSYRQGMHEILAPLIFVLHCDHMAYEHSCELSRLSDSTRNVGSVLLNSSFLEHDAHSMFYRLMQIIEPWYDSSVSRQDKTNDGNNNRRTCRSLSTSQRPIFADPRPFSRPKDTMPDCSIGERLSSIHDNVLRRQDLDLYLHLEHLEISPQMFGLRWLKLLFGREYTMQDLLMVWDVVFAVGDDFSLVDHIYVSMLVNIREFLLANDFATCLTKLMRYPTNVDVNRIVDLALHLFNPELYDKPKDISQYQMIPTFALTSRRKRAQRNKTIVGIETIANKFTSFISKKPPIEQSRPSILKYRQTVSSVSDSAPVTPTNKPHPESNHDRPIHPTNVDVSDYMEISMSNDQHQMIRMCVTMIDDSLASLQVQNVDQAVAILKQTRNILSGNLTINRKCLVSELQLNKPNHLKHMKSGHAVSLNRSVSNNDINLLLHAPCIEKYQNNGFDISHEILKLIPPFNSSVKTLELKDISSVKNRDRKPHMKT